MTCDRFHVSLDLNITFRRTPSDDAVEVIISNDPNAVPVTITEEQMLARYPWDYGELSRRLKSATLTLLRVPSIPTFASASLPLGPPIWRPLEVASSRRKSCLT